MLTPSWKKYATGKAGRPSKYPFATMEVGELVRIPVDEQTCLFSSFRVMASNAGRDHGRKFFVRINPEDGAFELFRGA